jgi:lon-related putative ATP-dependent protease
MDETTGDASVAAAPGLPARRLRRAADLSGLAFETTAELEPIEGLVGQHRALDALRLAAAMGRSGFNLFAIGRPEAGMRQAIHAVLNEAEPPLTPPSDWVYVNNFADARRPQAIALAPGEAPAFRDAMHELIEDLKAAIPAAFESEPYQNELGAINEAFQRQQSQAFEVLEAKAAERGIALLRTPIGFTMLPQRDGKVVPPEVFNTWPQRERDEVQAAAQSLEEDVERFVRQLPIWEKNRREAVRKLNRQIAERAVGHQILELIARFTGNPTIVAHLERVKSDLVDNIDIFAGGGVGPDGAMMPGGPFDRYEANVVVTQTDRGRAPVIEEPHPTLANLSGSIEHINVQGALVTNFRLIKAGALHRANGGFLLLDARNLLSEPFSWAALKRILRSRQIIIEDVAQLIGLGSTVSLEPDPIPLDIKVVLYGDRLLYYMLSALDPELSEHFKVLADFDDDLDRSPETEAILARLVAGLVKQEGLRPLGRGAVIAVIEHAARLAADSGKLSLLVDQLRDVLAEAEHWAKQAGVATIGAAEVERAIAERIRRAGRLRDRGQEAILKEIALIRTDGASVGEINGLSVIELGGFAFGQPTRISCQVRPGAGRLVDIEREVTLGGPIHSKGVLILSGFLGGRYALDTPMSLQASLVFEQSYAGVEGDSASSAELYALLSALAQAPLRQDLAVTGSVNQHGEIQAIGGVNEKIEGFFDLCAARGLTGSQGVLIPAANVQHLMLRPDVVEACAAGRFRVHAVSTIDEGLALMTGRPAGARGADGLYPEGSLNRQVEDRLHEFARIRRAFAGDEAHENDRGRPTLKAVAQPKD